MWFFGKKQINEEKKKTIFVDEEDILADALLKDVIEYVIRDCDKISTSLLIRRFRIGYNRAARYMYWLEEQGIISKRNGKKNQQVIVSDFEILETFTESEKSNTISSLEDMSGLEFEKYTAEILKANGFEDVQVTQASRDYGADIIAYKDEIKYAIQCKKYNSSVGIQSVQEVLGSKTMNDCHVAVVLTNNNFTTSARALASKNNVLLWDGNKLNELIHNYKKTTYKL